MKLTELFPRPVRQPEVFSRIPAPSEITPELIEHATRGELPTCVTVELHKDRRGRPVVLTGADMNEIVLGVGFWKRSGPADRERIEAELREGK